METDTYQLVAAQLARDEGRRNRPYLDTRSHLTIGIGRNLDVGLSEDEIDYLFANDLRAAEAACRSLFPDFTRYATARQAVLVNLAFNLGHGGLAEFRHMRAAVNSGAWNLAADELLDSELAKQAPARVHRLAEQLRSGVAV